MKGKDIGNIPGMGLESTAMLKSKGYEKAQHLFGLYLTMYCDQTTFDAWLQEHIPSMKFKQRNDAICCLHEYYNTMF